MLWIELDPVVIRDKEHYNPGTDSGELTFSPENYTVNPINFYHFYCGIFLFHEMFRTGKVNFTQRLFFRIYTKIAYFVILYGTHCFL